MKLPLWLHLIRQKGQDMENPTSDYLYKGVDVSEFNGEVDFQALQGQIDFAILRCGYGGNRPDQDDVCFAANVRNCNKADIPYGVYLYAYATNKAMAQSEADHVLRLIEGTDPDFGVWYDVEEESVVKSPNVVAVCKTWCDAVLNGGITCVGLYACLSVMEHPLDHPDLKKYERWVAQWNSSCEYPNPGIWQFTDKKILNGKVFDMNYAYKDYPEISGENMTQKRFEEMLATAFDDLSEKPAHSWAKEDWNAACQNKWFDGTGPQRPLTREEAAIVFRRMEKLQKR